VLIEDRLYPIDIALRIDHDRGLVTADDVAAVAEIGGFDGDDVEAGHGANIPMGVSRFKDSQAKVASEQCTGTAVHLSEVHRRRGLGSG